MESSHWLELGILPLLCSLLVLLSIVEKLLCSIEHGFDRKRRWPTNFLLMIFGLVISALSPISIVSAAAWGEANGFGLLNLVAMPVAMHMALSVFAFSLAGYVMHYASHAVPILWRFHAVHHCDHVVDASTSQRSHPLELVFVSFALSLAALLLGVSAFAALVYIAVELLLAVFNHSRMRLPVSLEWPLSRIIVTPAVHHIHHSSDQRETDSNYGNVLTIWDHLLGTFSRSHAPEDAPIHYGLQQVRPEAASDLDAMLRHPFRK